MQLCGRTKTTKHRYLLSLSKRKNRRDFCARGYLHCMSQTCLFAASTIYILPENLSAA